MKLGRHASLFVELDSLFNGYLARGGWPAVELDLVFLQETDWLVQAEALRGFCAYEV